MSQKLTDPIRTVFQIDGKAVFSAWLDTAPENGNVVGNILSTEDAILAPDFILPLKVNVARWHFASKGMIAPECIVTLRE